MNVPIVKLPHAGYIINLKYVRMVSPIATVKEGRKKSVSSFSIDFYCEQNAVSIRYEDDNKNEPNALTSLEKAQDDYNEINNCLESWKLER